jgi:hypothetical protein
LSESSKSQAPNPKQSSTFNIKAERGFEVIEISLGFGRWDLEFLIIADVDRGTDFHVVVE